MKQSKLFFLLLPFIIIAIPWVYLAFIWNELPAIVPTHFGFSGKPDAFGPKNEIFLAPIILSIVGPGVYFLLRNINRIDPKRKYAATTSGVLSKLAVVMLMLLCAIMLFIFYWTLHGNIKGMPFFYSIISLFIAYIGNLMHSIKPNYFAGFRLPWTLESEDNWRMTHILVSKLWFAGGIILAIASLVLNTKMTMIVFFSGMAVMVIVPIIYSYNLYKQSLKEKQ